MKNKTFSRATLSQRLAAVSGGGLWRTLPADSSLCLVEGRLAGCKVMLVASKPGSFGVDECADLQWALQRGRATGVPLLLLIDSAGAQSGGEIQAQGSLCALLREMLDARLAELPMLAVLGSQVPGAANMLASAAQQCIYSQHTLLAMPGPRRRPSAPQSTLNRILAPCRAAINDAGRLTEDDLDAYANAVRDWLARPFAASVTPDTLRQERQHLSQRLPAAGTHALDGPVLEGDTLRCMLGRPFGAADAIALAELAESACVTSRAKPLTIVVDSNGQDMSSPHDEDPDLAQYLIHMALSLRRLARAGRQLRLTVKNGIAASLYMALGAAAPTVEIAPGAVICTSSSASALFGSPAEARNGLGAVM
ncbi:MAG: biotin-independent malonate decarboxylase subunit gamma [Pseudomonadota bacterium]